MMMYAALCTAWTLFSGPTHYVSLATAAFFGLGTYAVGRFLVLLVADRLGIDPARAVDEAGGLLALLSLATAIAAIPIGRLADRE